MRIISVHIEIHYLIIMILRDNSDLISIVFYFCETWVQLWLNILRVNIKLRYRNNYKNIGESLSAH